MDYNGSHNWSYSMRTELTVFDGYVISANRKSEQDERQTQPENDRLSSTSTLAEICDCPSPKLSEVLLRFGLQQELIIKPEDCTKINGCQSPPSFSPSDFDNLSVKQTIKIQNSHEPINPKEHKCKRMKAKRHTSAWRSPAWKETRWWFMAWE